MPAPLTPSASDYARDLLADCGVAPAPLPASSELDPGLSPAAEWARSGAMCLTGPAAGPPALSPGPLALAARGAALALAALAPESRELAGLDGPALLGERAARMNLARRGRIAPGGSCRLLAARDGWLAVNLPRPDDRELLPAWLESSAQPGEDPWAFAERVLPERTTEAWVNRGRLLGLALAALPGHAPPASPEPWLRIGPTTPRVGPPSTSPRVLDLSSLWAGPLCAQLLAAAGAEVIKLESRQRPDGARRGEAGFYSLMNAGKQSVALDLDSSQGMADLHRLLEWAEIVVESARPRALAQLGITAEDLVVRGSGRVWLSITGHGRQGECGHWVGFGDDAAVAAGAAIRHGDGAPPSFCGDAIADPLTGLHAAVASLAHHRTGRGALLDVSLSAVTRHALETPAPERGVDVGANGEGWRVLTATGVEAVAPPRARASRGPAADLGADTARLLDALARQTRPGDCL
ncbi:MAG: CoA transferase [Myxococcota bacterium]|nr:CoA transferase [Myxococcota bacterium]